MDASKGPRQGHEGCSSCNPDVTIFCPKGQQSRVSFDNTPTYLFRLHVPGSVGATTIAEVSSPAWNHGGDYRNDLFQLPLDQAAACLDDHLQGRCEDRCTLVSWSSSLLFVLQYAIYRHTTDVPRPRFSDLHLLMIDTRQFARGTFLRDLDALDELHTHSEDLTDLRERRMGDAYYGEYLTQGRLSIDGKCGQTSMKRLIDMDVFWLCPPLGIGSQWDKLDIAILSMRKRFDKLSVAISEEDFGLVIAMARECFGDRLAFPFAVMVLSLQHRQYDDGVITDWFRDALPTGELESLHPGELKFDAESRRIAELNEYQKMMVAIDRHLHVADAPGGLKPSRND